MAKNVNPYSAPPEVSSSERVEPEVESKPTAPAPQISGTLIVLAVGPMAIFSVLSVTGVPLVASAIIAIVVAILLLVGSALANQGEVQDKKIGRIDTSFAPLPEANEPNPDVDPSTPTE